MATTAGRAWAQAEIHPGTLRGSVSFSGETLYGTSSSISASATDGSGLSGNRSFGGSTYSLIVPGGHPYRATLNAYLLPQSYVNVNRSSPTYSVPVGGEAVADFHYETARITLDVQVTGGTIYQLNLYANAAEGTESYNGYGYAYPNTTSGSLVLPMIRDSAVNVYGYVYVRRSDGSTIATSIPSRSIALGESGASVSFTWDVPAPPPPSPTNYGSIAGEMRVENADTFFNYSYVYASGASSQYQYLYSPISPFTFSNLSLGTSTSYNYYTYGYTYFRAPFNFLQHPAQYTLVSAGQTSTRNFSASLQTGKMRLNWTGDRPASWTAYGYFSGGGWNQYDYIDSDSTMSFAAPPGTYSNTQLVLYGYPTNGYFQYVENDYTRPAVTVTAGSPITIPDYELTTVSTDIIFDVVEGAGAPEVLITQPYINGSLVNASGRSASLYARYNGTTGRPSVRVTGRPGTYQIYAYGSVNGQSIVFGNFRITLEVPQQTSSGDDVVVSPIPSVTITFDQVTTGGVTSATVSPLGPQPPAGWDVYAPNGQKAFYDLQTTAVT
ncbi:MAG: hypothetical protein F9K40_19355, partial [Kofleriaceae bacterium]